jgi:hypothetical protein
MQTVLNEAPPKVAEASKLLNRHLEETNPAFAEQFRSRRGVSVEEMQKVLAEAPPKVREAADLMNRFLSEREESWGESMRRRGGFARSQMELMRQNVPPIVAGTGDDMNRVLADRHPAFKSTVGRYQNTLVGGINTVFLASNGKGGLVGIEVGNAADGAIMEFFAKGGMKEKHQAQIAKAGDWRVWAEPETGGEAYIPLSPAKRDRSTAILEEVADRFGLSLRDLKDLPEGVDYHDGGLYVPPPAPGLPGYGPPVRPSGEKTMGNAREFTAEWARKHMELAHHQAPPPGSGGSSRGPGGGGNVTARVRAVLGDYPGTRVTSTYRSPSRNAAVGGAKNSLHMDKSNPATDIGGPTGQLDRLHGRLRGMGGWRELLWRVRGHFDHIHAAEEGMLLNTIGGGAFNGAQSFDSGGMLRPGWTAAYNGTGKPERVMEAPVPAQAQQLDFSGIESRIAAAVSKAIGTITRDVDLKVINPEPMSPQRLAREIARAL